MSYAGLEKRGSEAAPSQPLQSDAPTRSSHLNTPPDCAFGFGAGVSTTATDAAYFPSAGSVDVVVVVVFTAVAAGFAGALVATAAGAAVAAGAVVAVGSAAGAHAAIRTPSATSIDVGITYLISLRIVNLLQFSSKTRYG